MFFLDSRSHDDPESYVSGMAASCERAVHAEKVVVDHPDHRGVLLPVLFTHAVRIRHCTFRWLCLHTGIKEL